MKGVFSSRLSFVSLTATHDVLCGSCNIPEGGHQQYKRGMALRPGLDRCPEGRVLSVGPRTSLTTEAQGEEKADRPGALGPWPLWA